MLTILKAPNAKRPRPAGGKVIRNANISKPQLQFQVKPDNFPTTPWKPILTEKPHAKVPLDESLTIIQGTNGSKQYKHPYETEIKEMEYPGHVYQKAAPIPYQPVEGTSAIFVDTFEGVLEMLEQLKEAKEIAVDLEHHDFRTYTGLVSLMQISTRTHDWIVDTLQPWRHRLQILNQVFADPSILKVFHGAYMDMIWLQRDLGLYINGLFDTYFACVLLSYQAKSLSYLLSRFVNFDADKQYQTADWRIRPLPEEMLYYARSDTHYLLYIYDCVRNDLINSSNSAIPGGNLMQEALNKSKDLALSRHEHATFDDETGHGSRGWYNFVVKQGHLAFNIEQFAVFRALWKWRDDAARQEDESPNNVLGSHQISEIAKINPPDKKALHSLLPRFASIARPRLGEIWDAIQASKARGGLSLVNFLSATSPEFGAKAKASAFSRQDAVLPASEGDVTVSKLSKSQLFGTMPISSRWEGSRETAPNEDDQVPYPWQRYAQLMSDLAESGDAIDIIESEPAAQIEAAAADVVAAAEEPVDEEFTLKRGKKRKSAPSADTSSSSDSSEDDEEEEEEEEESSPAPQDEENLPDADASGLVAFDDDGTSAKKSKKKKSHEERQSTAAEERHRIRQEKRDKKKAKQARQHEKIQKRREKENEKKGTASTSPSTKESFNAVPFDYSQATTVLHASRNKPSKEKGAKKPTFDPYSKIGDDEIKGARKAMPVRGERSGTFKK